VHYCAFCGWRREAASLTVLTPRCPQCGCRLSSCTWADYERSGLGAEDASFEAEPRRDASASFVAVAAGPFLLPVLGVALGDLIFAVPLALLVFATFHCWGTARRGGDRRSIWLWLGAAAGATALCSLIAVLSSVVGVGTKPAFYLGATGSLAMLGGMIRLVRVNLPVASRERVVDGLLVGILLLATAAFFIIAPGLSHGDALLSLLFLVDLLAVVAGVLAMTARPACPRRRVTWVLTGMAVAVTAGNGLVSAGAAAQIVSSQWATALFWAIAAYLLALASELERAPEPVAARPVASAEGMRWVWVRVVLPVVAVLVLPAVAVALWLGGELTSAASLWFGLLGVVVLVLAFGRQAYLVVDNHRAVVRERQLRSEAVRRNEELEALTGLATTMTQSLEETPIIERGLGVLHLAARSRSSAVHVWTDKGLELRAVAGEWHAERASTVDAEQRGDAAIEQIGRREIARLALSARGHEIGLVTIVRPDQSPYSASELDLLRLLVDQLSIAVQNARDYREKLDQAIRDPLTGLYNRRFFYETLNKELHRTERYGSTVSIVLLDIDDFKAINDSLGHAAGDDALRRIAQVVQSLMRATDSFARLGGEEFAVLLPETDQLDALLVAERLRTTIARHKILPDRRVTVSGGVSSCPQDATCPDELIRQADAALYWAKRNGKNLSAIASEVVLDDERAPGDTMLAHMHALVSVIDVHELSTKDHSENVAAYAVALGQALGLASDHVVRLRRAGFLHDIGKVAVRRAVLEKPGPLDADEWEEMKIHPSVGAIMLAHAGLGEEASWIRHHHERIDGRGYPDGLAGEQIPLESRILFVADAFEAMTADRPYHRGVEVGEALAELRRCAGTQFDPHVVATLERLFAEDEIALLALHGV
jgi:diguanylate cyclase (GGDEF)-like protein